MNEPPGIYDIEMPSGHYVDVSAPVNADIRIEDIAHKLAQTNRFGGATIYPYPVAQHAVFVSRRMEACGHGPAECWAGLHHDDGEYIATDIQKPIKVWVEDQTKGWEDGKDLLGALEQMWQYAIEEHLELPSSKTHKSIIKEADVFAVLIEAKNLMPSKGRYWRAREQMRQWKLEVGALPERLRTPSYWLGELHWMEARDRKSVV